MDRLKRKIQLVERKRRYAWAKFYEARELEHVHMLKMIEMYNNKTNAMPNHIKNELKELYDALKQTVCCPICLHEINKDDLDWSQCGHKYCKACLQRLKNTSNKCALCRRDLQYKK